MFFGRGLLSDDTEHTAMVARALARSGGEVESFARYLARELKLWLLTLPPGIGFGTLRSCLRLLVGFGPDRSGVDSAGNGPAMRAALLGVVAHDDEHLLALVRSSTRITHTDPRAEDGARVVARMARSLAITSKIRPEDLEGIADAHFQERVLTAFEARDAHLERFRSLLEYERGVSGFIVHTLPAVIWCTARHLDDPRAGIEAAIRLGGDTDTVAAIVGALLGARLGVHELDGLLLDGIRDQPLSKRRLRSLAVSLADDGPPPNWSRGLQLLRNLALIPVLLAHIGWRLLGR